MFFGSVPSSMQRIVREVTDSWDCKDINVGCSGNFTIERILDHDKFSIHSCDVTIYSYILGAYFSGGRPEIRLKEELEGTELWQFNEYMDTDIDKVSTSMIFTSLLNGMGKDDNTYYRRMNQANINQFPRMHEDTKNRILSSEFSIASYFNGDVVDWVQGLDKSSGFISFPPFYTGDYKNMFKNLESVLDWEEPDYVELDADRKALLIEEAMKHKYWLLGFNFKVPELKEYMVGITQTTNRGVPIYLYGTSEVKRVVTPNQNTDTVKYARLGADEDIGEKISIQVIDYEDFQTLRSLYMSRHINPGQASAAVGVFVDGKMIGVYAFMSYSSIPLHFEGLIETPYIYMLSDFPVAPTKYKHLAKLVVIASVSSESKLLAERSTSSRVRSLMTTAFSKNSVSMKYRGILDLYNRSEVDHEADPNQHEDHKYKLNYYAPMGKWSLQEGFDMWKKKYGEVRQNG